MCFVLVRRCLNASKKVVVFMASILLLANCFLGDCGAQEDLVFFDVQKGVEARTRLNFSEGFGERIVRVDPLRGVVYTLLPGQNSLTVRRISFAGEVEAVEEVAGNDSDPNFWMGYGLSPAGDKLIFHSARKRGLLMRGLRDKEEVVIIDQLDILPICVCWPKDETVLIVSDYLPHPVTSEGVRKERSPSGCVVRFDIPQKTFEILYSSEDLSSNCIDSIAFSPDGHFLAYIPRPSNSEKEMLKVIDLAGKGLCTSVAAPQEMRESPFAEELSWNPDGTELAFSGGSNRVFIFSAKDKRTRFLTEVDAGGSISGLGYLTQGELVYGVEDININTKLGVLSVDDGRTRTELNINFVGAPIATGRSSLVALRQPLSGGWKRFLQRLF